MAWGLLHQHMCCCAGAASFTRVGEGVAGPKEIWNVGNAQGKGVKACYEAVKSDARCPSPKYFTYVARADQNCGCKGSSGSLTIRADANADYYRIKDGVPVPSPRQPGVYSMCFIHWRLPTRSSVACCCVPLAWALGAK